MIGTVVETLPAPYMGARIVEVTPLDFNVQYEYAREGRPKLYGGVQTQTWRTVCYEGHGGREGPKRYGSLYLARAAARRIIRNNNGGSAA